jgi:diadenosine tetraphosphate (Ap4A) HIT family hydrolase
MQRKTIRRSCSLQCNQFAADLTRRTSRPDHLESERVEGCLACDLAEGRLSLPGGIIHESPHWLVEHCVGPLGVGTLLVKTKRHVTRVAELTEDEAAELGPLLRRTAAAVDQLLAPEQVYTWLFSHAGAQPVHVHYVVQPATREAMDEFGEYGPQLTTAMFSRGEQPAVEEVEVFAERARALF